MPKLFYFEEVNSEKRWTCELEITFNYRLIIKITITDHYLVKHEEITNELILKLLEKLNGEIAEPIKYQGKREIFRWKTSYQGQKYRLIFWFKDQEPNHLWIRNCYPVN